MTWEYLYKIDYVDGTLNSTNLLYAPLINKENNVLCMDFADTVYHKRPLGTSIREYFFDREVHNLEIFKKYKWCPNILDIQEKRIYIDLGARETLNQIVMDKTRDLNSECYDWKKQIRTILDDINNEDHFKVTLYPHCFVTAKGLIKTTDFYGCIASKDRIMPIELVSELIGSESVHRFTEATIDGKIDFKIFYDRLITHHLFNYWPELF